eukprot:519838-Pelagomonas_calceolata.AAC.3
MKDLVLRSLQAHCWGSPSVLKTLDLDKCMMPTGTGKTITLLSLITSYQLAHPEVRVFWKFAALRWGFFMADWYLGRRQHDSAQSRRSSESRKGRNLGCAYNTSFPLQHPLHLHVADNKLGISTVQLGMSRFSYEHTPSTCITQQHNCGALQLQAVTSLRVLGVVAVLCIRAGTAHTAFLFPSFKGCPVPLCDVEGCAVPCMRCWGLSFSLGVVLRAVLFF